jgi:uncharacterized protein (DUF1778 family)
MPAKRPDTRSSETSVPLNFRIKPSVRDLIDRAAEVLGTSRTDFMIEASERRAEDVLARLDAPPAQNERLQRTMQTKAPWDAA